MNRMKKKSILYFLLCFGVFLLAEELLSIPLGAVESSMEVWPERLRQLAVAGFLVLTLLNIAGCAWLFSRLIGKLYQKENQRQLNERNMLYSCIAHDLKTPMTSVQGFAAALREGRVKPEEAQEIYGIIYNKSCYMNELLDTMFAYAKLNTEGYALSPAALDVCALVRNLTALHYDGFEQQQMDVVIDIPEEAILIQADEKELKRAISNLLANAYKHNPSGAAILIRVFRQGGCAGILVADSGKPIDKAEAKTLFEPFARGDASRSGGGSGLGLAITKLIAEKHGGTLTVEEGIEGYTKGFVLRLRQN